MTPPRAPPPVGAAAVGGLDRQPPAPLDEFGGTGGPEADDRAPGPERLADGPRSGVADAREEQQRRPEEQGADSPRDRRPLRWTLSSSPCARMPERRRRSSGPVPKKCSSHPRAAGSVMVARARWTPFQATSLPTKTARRRSESAFHGGGVTSSFRGLQEHVGPVVLWIPWSDQNRAASSFWATTRPARRAVRSSPARRKGSASCGVRVRANALANPARAGKRQGSVGHHPLGPRRAAIPPHGSRRMACSRPRW